MSSNLDLSKQIEQLRKSGSNTCILGAILTIFVIAATAFILVGFYSENEQLYTTLYDENYLWGIIAVLALVQIAAIFLFGAYRSSLTEASSLLKECIKQQDIAKAEALLGKITDRQNGELDKILAALEKGNINNKYLYASEKSWMSIELIQTLLARAS